MLYRKDYKEIGKIIKESDSKDEMIDRLISYFIQDNLLFDEDKFRKEVGFNARMED